MNNRIATTLALFTLLLTIQGCSSILSATTAEPLDSAPDKRSTGSYIDDEIIEVKALVNIDKASPELAQSHISVTSYNGIVLLAGQVSTEAARQLAAQTAAAINKVRRVHNEITVSGQTSLVARTNDSWITTKIKTRLMAAADVQSHRIKVVTENGVVYLMGIVSREEADRATELARTTAGAQKVVKLFEYF